MKIKNTKNFIDFCNEIGLKTFFSDIPVKKFNYNINNNALREKNHTNFPNDNQNKQKLLKNLKERVEKLDCNLKKHQQILFLETGT